MSKGKKELIESQAELIDFLKRQCDEYDDQIAYWKKKCARRGFFALIGSGLALGMCLYQVKTQLPLYNH